MLLLRRLRGIVLPGRGHGHVAQVLASLSFRNSQASDDVFRRSNAILALQTTRTVAAVLTPILAAISAPQTTRTVAAVNTSIFAAIGALETLETIFAVYTSTLAVFSGLETTALTRHRSILTSA